MGEPAAPPNEVPPACNLGHPDYTARSFESKARARDSTGTVRPRTMRKPSRRQICLLLQFVACGTIALAGTACSKIEWKYDFIAAESQAHLEQKDLFVYFRRWSSPHCAQLESDWLLSAPEVKPALKDSVNCWLEWDWSQEIARKYRVRGYPAFVLVRPNRRATVLAGAVTLEQFLAFVARAKSPPPLAQP